MGTFEQLGMPLESFQNEQQGNKVVWRVIQNEYSDRFFVYRRVDRGDGRIITEYLHKDGRVDMFCGDEGWHSNLLEVGVSLVSHGTLLSQNGNANGTSYGEYLARFLQGD